MGKTKNGGDDDDNDNATMPAKEKKKDRRLKELGVSCMLNTEVGALLAVIRHPSDPTSQTLPSGDDNADSHFILSLKTLRFLIFQPHDEWRTIDPATYVTPFVNVIQSDEIPAPATAVALSAILKILHLNIFDEKTPGAREAIHSIVHGINNCRLERTDPMSEDAVLMRILQVLLAVMRSRASVLLNDHAICTIVNTCFQVVQQSACQGDMLQKNARHTMHELIQLVFSKLLDIQTSHHHLDPDAPAYGAQCMVDIFHFICSLLNVVVERADGLGPVNWDEDVQFFALVLINSAIELGGESIGKHPRLLWMIQDELFYNLIYYGIRSSPLFLSMICSTVLNLYHLLRRSLRVQLEAFLRLVLIRIASSSGVVISLIHEVAVEGIISFCRQPTFVIEMYVNYDCDPLYSNIFEDICKVLCKIAFPTTTPFSPTQVQALEGLVTIIGTIAVDNVDILKLDEEVALINIMESEDVDTTEDYFWFEKLPPNNLDGWVRSRKNMKKKVAIGVNHFNLDEKKGLEFLKISKVISDDPKSLAFFFRYSTQSGQELDKNKIGDYLGDPHEFNIQVLKEFTSTFDFMGVINLDTALRTYLDTFRLPGESQKIQRILEAFSDRFYDQQQTDQNNNIFASKDSVFILCYSLIMLNTDQHNPQVKKKMTEEEFIRNNRAINAGKDLPREYLSDLFYSISNNAITLTSSGSHVDSRHTEIINMNPNRWVELLKTSRSIDQYYFIMCDPDDHHKLGRELFVAISGPSVSCLSAIFDHADDQQMLQHTINGLLYIARIAHQHGLDDILDQLLTCFCKFTTLLNPYASPEETLFSFSNDLKPRLATLAVFTIANKYGGSIRGGWRNLIDCLLKLNRFKLLPPQLCQMAVTPFIEPSVVDSGGAGKQQQQPQPQQQQQLDNNNNNNLGYCLMAQFLSVDDSSFVAGELDNNLKLIQQCQIGNIFSGTAKLPDDSLLNLGRALIFAAAGKNHKFTTPIEEEETVGLCWELLSSIITSNLNRFLAFWPQFHDYLNLVAQFPLFSPCPFAEKAMLALFNVFTKLLSSTSTVNNKPAAEDLILKSINLAWKLDKEILDTCCETIIDSIVHILTEKADSVQTLLGWKTLLHLLSVAGRHPETYDKSVKVLIKLMEDAKHVSRFNYAYFIDAAFGFAALKISPLQNSLRILELMAESVALLLQWHKPTGLIYSSETTNLLDDNNPKSPTSFVAANLFLKLAEALRKMSLVRREEIRNHAIAVLRTIFRQAMDLEFTHAHCIGCFNVVIFAMIDDLHEKTVEYSRREKAEREMRSMEGTLKEAMEMLVEVYLNFLTTLQQSPGFRTFWLGVLRRMDTCMKANEGTMMIMQQLVPNLLKTMILEMKEKEVLVQKEGNELWEVTNIQIQWIAPSVKDELFPDH